MEHDDKRKLARSIIGKEHQAEESDAVFGTAESGYAPARCGPFECKHCVHSSGNGNRCDHPDVKSDPDVKKDGKLAVVDPGGCCTYFRPQEHKEGRV